MSGLFLTLIFVTAALVVVAAYSLFQDIRRDDSRRLKRRMADDAMAITDRPGAELLDVFGEGEGAAWMLDELQPKTPLQRLRAMIEQAGLSTPPRTLFTRGCLFGALMAALGWILSGRWWLAPVAFLIGFAFPFLAVVIKRRRRLDKLASQLPDVFALMSRVMRAGQTTETAIELVGQEFDDPVAGEFAFCYEEQRLGLSTEVALRDLARRTGLLEVKMFVVASTVQHEAGGNLAELLDNLSQVIRERFRVRRTIRSLTAEGRLQAAVLLLLPFVLFILLSLMHPTYFTILFDYPWVIVAALVSEFIGALWVRKIVSFDY